MDIKTINANIDAMWARLKSNLLGNADIGKALLITSDAEPLSLSGIFDQAVKESGGLSDLEALNGLLNVASSYMEAEKAKLKAKLFNKINNLEAQSQTMSDVEAMEFLDEEIGKIFETTKVNIERIAVSEAQNTKNIAFLNGILSTNAKFGIDDPVVVFITTKNPQTVCEHCRKLHCVNMDLNKPRPWKLSELKFDYAGRNPTAPSIHGLHPNCECLLITILPGFGYKSGTLAFVANNYSYYDEFHSA